MCKPKYVQPAGVSASLKFAPPYCPVLAMCRNVSRWLHYVGATVKAVTDDRRGMNARDCQSVALPEACLQAEGELKMQKKELRVGKAQLS